jgi:hypothetical protein
VRRTVLRTLQGALCTSMLCAVPSLAQTDALQAARGGDAWSLSLAGEAARLETPGGRRLRLALPARAEASSLAAVDDGWAGWIAAGSFLDEEGNRRLFLLAGNDRESRALPEPPGRTGRERRFPVLLADGGRLAGMAWLEGDDARSFAVRSAVWNGRRWSAPQTVSAPGPGSQTGLAGTVLADGSWLLAWSAFDGEDNEIVWSRRLGGRWLPPAPVSAGNGVPDITPALISSGTPAVGAVIAWSRYDGKGYSLVLSRFTGQEWRDERPGPPGALYPSFSGDADRARLLFFNAEPRGWGALEIDESGKVLRRAVVTAPFAERPVVEAAAGELRLHWPAREQAGAAAWVEVP